MMRIDQALIEQLDCFFIFLIGDRLLGQFYTTNLILCGYLAFATLPWMEGVGLELLHGFFIAPKLIEQGNLFEHEVIVFAFRDEDAEGAFAVVYRRNDGDYGLLEDVR